MDGEGFAWRGFVRANHSPIGLGQRLFKRVDEAAQRHAIGDIAYLDKKMQVIGHNHEGRDFFDSFFSARPETRPMIYAYEEDNPKYAGMLKVGFASAGVFMLRNLKSPDTYFQTAFRVQSPWVIDGESGREIIKKECFCELFVGVTLPFGRWI